MLTCEEIIQIQEKNIPEPENVYNDFKKKIDDSIKEIPEYAKKEYTVDFYKVTTIEYICTCEGNRY